MRVLLFFVALSFAYTAKAQVIISDVDINTLEHVEYVEMVGIQRFMSNKIAVRVDYGQAQKIFQGQRIKDMNGRNMVFNSMIDALNFMEMNGWEYVNNYQVHTDENDIFRFLLKRKKDKSMD